MEDFFWVNLCQPIPLSATHHECGTIVAESTLRIRQCLTQLTSLLEQRSLALLKCAQFDTALRDTNAILKLVPTQALGYLLKGKVYTYCGQQQQATDVFDQGLSIARGTDDEQLLKAKAYAEMMQQKRVDFISKLPLDVVCTTIVPLLMDDETWSRRNPCPYLQVSRIWRERFARGKLCYYVDDNNPYPAQAVCFINSVHSMDIYASTTQVGVCISRQLSTLRRMRISGSEPGNGMYFLHCLQKVGASLQDLEIHWSRATIMVTIRDIMERCPHLSSLITFRVPSGNMTSTLHPYPPIMQPRPSLVTLELHRLLDPVDHQYTLSLLQSYPSLQSLIIYPCHASHFLTIIHQHCPFLQHLVISTQTSIIPAPHTSKGKNNQHGLRSFYIQDDNAQYYNSEDIRQCMMTHSATLESATIMVGTWHDDPDPPAAVQFPQLHHLRCSLGTAHGPPLFGWWIPYHAPALEHVDLSNATFHRSSRLLEALCNTPQIRSLALNAARVANQPLVQLIEAVGRHGCLEELALFTELSSVTYAMVQHAIGTLTQLKRLSLGKGMIPHKREEFNDLVFHLTIHCYHLRELNIKACTQGLNTGLLALSTLDHLESITIPAMDLYAGGVTALAKFPRLRHLTLHGIEQPELKDALERLQQTHPHLNISWRNL